MPLSKEKVLRLTEHVSYIPFSTNIGFVKIRDSIYIVDTVNDELKMGELLDFIKAEFPSAHLKAVIATHSHADHCGGNAILQETTGCEIWASRGEASLMEYPLIETMLIWGGSPFHDLCSQNRATPQGFFPTTSAWIWATAFRSRRFRFLVTILTKSESSSTTTERRFFSWGMLFRDAMSSRNTGFNTFWTRQNPRSRS